MNALTQQMANMSLNDPKKGKSNFPIAVPKTLRYEQDAGLPVAIAKESGKLRQLAMQPRPSCKSTNGLDRVSNFPRHSA